MELKETIKQILEAVGGKENIKNSSHCATRLRLILHDDSKLDKSKIDDIIQCKGYFFNTGQHQLIFGTGKVNEVYAELQSELGVSETEKSNFKEDVYSNMPIFQKFMRILADVLVPLIPVLVTTGLLMGIRGLLVNLGMPLTEEQSTLFGMLTDTAFAFLPVLVVYSSTKLFGGNPMIGIVIGIMMVAPQLPNAYAVAKGAAEPIRLFGIGIAGYQGSIIPAIAAGYIASFIEKKLRKIIPQVIDLIVTPFTTILITISIMLLVFGPILRFVENSLISFFVSILALPLGIGYVVFGGMHQLLTITGLHHSLNIVQIGFINETGKNVIQTLATASMAGQFGAALSTAFLVNNKKKRADDISTTASTLFGITEPLLFGINLRNIRIFVSGMIGGSIGGLATYILGLKANGMGVTFLPGLLLYSDSATSMLKYIVVILVAFISGALLVQMQRNAIKNAIN